MIIVIRQEKARQLGKQANPKGLVRKRGGRNSFSDELFFNPKGREAHSLLNNLFPAVFPVLGAKDVTEGEGLSL